MRGLRRNALVGSLVALAVGITAAIVLPVWIMSDREEPGPGAKLPACAHFSDEVPPERSAGTSSDSRSQGTRIDLSGRIAAPENIQGVLSGETVTLSFGRVAGAVAYRVWRNGQSVARVEDFGQESLSVTDPEACRGAYYTVAALTGPDSDASTGQLSQPYRIADDGSILASPLAEGTTLTYTITSYNDSGHTASGYTVGLGFCAVDARDIPLGTRLRVDGYGDCYAGDIGTWIQGDIIDVWLPEAEAADWGVQTRTVTVVG